MRLPVPTALGRGSRRRLLQALALLLALWILSVLSPYRLALVRKTEKRTDTQRARTADPPSIALTGAAQHHNVSQRTDVIEQLDHEDGDGKNNADDDEDDEEDSDGDDPDRPFVQKINPDYKVSGEATDNVDAIVTRICTEEERQAHLRAYCEKNYRQPVRRRRKRWARHLIVDNNNYLAYCPLAKVACTSWKALLVYAQNYTTDSWPPVHNKKYLNKAGLKTMKQLNKKEKARVLESYYKYIVVRHPFDRLVSAWRDKLVERNSPYRRSMGRKILEIYRNSTNFETVPEWNDTARFDEFAEYLSDRKVGNPHWSSYHRTCRVCTVPYDGVFRTETAENDGKSFLKEHLPHYRGAVPFIHSHQEDRGSLSMTTKVLSEFERVSPKAFDYLLQLYGPDLEMFGYKWDRKTNTAKCSIQTPDGTACC